MVNITKNLRERLVDRFVVKPLKLMRKSDIDNMRKYLESEYGRRTPIGTNEEQISKIVELPYNYEVLLKYAFYNEVVRTVHDAIIREVVRNRWEVKPKWQCKCPQCGVEYQTNKEKCPDCQVETMLPDSDQKKMLQAFLDYPNPDNEFLNIVKSTMRYMLSVDDWWLSIQYANTETPLTMYVEDSVYMRVCADKKGRIGNKEYFCPICTEEDPNNIYSSEGMCRKHKDTKLKETAYAYVDGGEIKARFSKDEILHGITEPFLPSLYGKSKLVSCIRILLSLTAMDKWNFDIYTTGKLAQILVFHGLNQNDVNELMTEAKKQRDLVEEDPQTAAISNKLRTLGLGTKEGVTKVDAMPPSEKMQSIDWWKLWREVVCAVYGVTPIFVGVVESGKTGANPRMQIDVQNNTTEMYQRSFEEPFNNIIVPKLGVYDWKFEFNPVEEKDEMQDISVLQAKVETVIRAANAGMQAELTDEGEVHISGKPKPVKPSQAYQPKNPFEEENPFAQEKSVKKGKSWIVTEVNSDSGSGKGDSKDSTGTA